MLVFNQLIKVIVRLKCIVNRKEREPKRNCYVSSFIENRPTSNSEMPWFFKYTNPTVLKAWYIFLASICTSSLYSDGLVMCFILKAEKSTTGMPDTMSTSTAAILKLTLDTGNPNHNSTNVTHPRFVFISLINNTNLFGVFIVCVFSLHLFNFCLSLFVCLFLQPAFRLQFVSISSPGPSPPINFSNNALRDSLFSREFSDWKFFDYEESFLLKNSYFLLYSRKHFTAMGVSGLYFIFYRIFFELDKKYDGNSDLFFTRDRIILNSTSRFRKSQVKEKKRS